jgi:NhaP-type Na+/H+ or K+/H+ antiporter
VEDFNTTVLVFAVLLVLGALLSGVAHRSFLSLTAFFVVAGFVLGDGALKVIHFDARGAFVSDLAVVALVVILFRDGLEVEREMLQRAWHLPLRKLVLAMPITCVLIALVTHAVTSLSWAQSFLLGALLSPTDPVLSSAVVTNPRVPRVIRHSLNLESGLNDGLALPAVLAFAAVVADRPGFVWWRFVLEDVGLGLAFGVAVGFIASRLLPRGRGLEEEVGPHVKSLYALGVAFAAYGVAVVAPAGNGLISTFVAAITLGILRSDVRTSFSQRSVELVELVKLSVFVVFGSLLTLDGLFGDGWAAVAIVAFTLLVARPAAVAVALTGTETDAPTRAFMAWFGPKGVATMTFSLLVLGQGLPGGEEIFNLAALVVFVSIIAHGLTDTPGAEWIARVTERRRARQALRV